MARTDQFIGTQYGNDLQAARASCNWNTLLNRDAQSVTQYRQRQVSEEEASSAFDEFLEDQGSPSSN